MASPKAQNASFHRWQGMGPALCIAVVLTLTAAALVLAGGGWVALQSPHRAWIHEALSNRTFILCGLVTLGCIVVMSALGGMLWHAGAAYRRKRRSEDGNILLEFTLALPFLLMLSLLMTQSSLLMGGNLCVHYAAYCAARSAIVQIPSNLNQTEPHNTLLDSGAKQQKIKAAAVWALWPVSCGSSAYSGSVDVSVLTAGVSQFCAGYGISTDGVIPSGMDRRLAYAAEYTTVNLSAPADGKKYADHEDIRISLTHTLYLSVPFAGKLFATLSSDGDPLGFGTGEYGMKIYANCTLTNEGVQDYIEAETIPSQ